MTGPLFQIRGAPTADLPSAVMGVWQTVPAEAASSFDVNAPPVPETPVWSVALDPGTADANLQQAQDQLLVTQKALREAGARLDQFIQAQSRGAAFVLEADTREPESDLQALLNQVGTSKAAADFGVLGFFGVNEDELVARFREFLDQLCQLLGDPLLVETQDQAHGSVVAETAVRWAGHTQTALIADSGNPLRAQHVRALVLALGQREVLFQIAGLAAEGAGRLALLAAMPGSAVVMIPGIYKFITQVMDEYSKIRQQFGRAS